MKQKISYESQHIIKLITNYNTDVSKFIQMITPLKVILIKNEHDEPGQINNIICMDTCKTT